MNPAPPVTSTRMMRRDYADRAGPTRSMRLYLGGQGSIAGTHLLVCGARPAAPHLVAVSVQGRETAPPVECLETAGHMGFWMVRRHVLAAVVPTTQVVLEPHVEDDERVAAAH